MPTIVKESIRLQPLYWLERYGDYLYRFAIQRVTDQATASDLLQDTFLSALERSSLFEGNCTELTWLRVIMKNKIIDHYRKRSATLHAPLPDESGPERLEVKEFYFVLESCLQELPFLWRSVFKRRYLEDETAEEICRSLGISPSNYWVIVHRARVQLRERLTRKGYELVCRGKRTWNRELV